MADSSTTHLNLIKQDLNAAPDFGKENTNLDTIDSEIYARAKAFNGEPVGEDGGFHINTVPFAENLQSYSGQSSDGTFIVRTTGGEASIDNGDASITLIRGARTHYGYSPQSVSEPVISMMPRSEDEDGITAVVDADTFIAAVSSASGTVTFNYSTSWSPDVATYGITVAGTPLAGDSISVTYAKEVPGTIIQSNPQKFISTGWNLYNHSKGYARVTNYSSDYGYKISGTYISIGFSETEDGTPETITPVNGLFTVPGDGYVFVTGGNNTDTAIWPTWSDWVLGYRWDEATESSGAFQTYTESVIDLSSLFGENNPFPYGLMQVGDVHDEINLNTRFATSYIMRIENTAGNMSSAVSSGREFEYDEDYIYIVRESPIIYSANISGEYTADDHGIEYFTETEQAVSVHTIYGSNLKNKLERDVLTISQQELTDSQQAQVQTNIGILELVTVPSIKTTNLNDATDTRKNYYSESSALNNPVSNWHMIRALNKSGNYCTQIATTMNSLTGAMYLRTKDSTGAWGTWQRIATTTMLPQRNYFQKTSVSVSANSFTDLYFENPYTGTFLAATPIIPSAQIFAVITGISTSRLTLRLRNVSSTNISDLNVGLFVTYGV